MGRQSLGTQQESLIPVFDATKQYRSIKKQIQRSVNDVLESGCYIGGRFTDSFEQRLASYCGTKYAVACSNGTAAIYLALLDAGIKADDEVLVPSHTFIATIEAITLVGAKPVFCDISPYSHNIRADEIESKRTSQTKAIIPVHMYGNMCDMRMVNGLAKKFNLTVIEDSCQAIGSEQDGRKAGSLGDYGCFSFYPTKNLGACGDGGAIVTNSKKSYLKLKKLINHNSESKYLHSPGGFNFRISEIQSAVLFEKINFLDDWIRRRREIAAFYDGGLRNVTKPEQSRGNKHSYHLYVIRTQQRKSLCDHLAKRKIGFGLHYPIPCHEQYGIRVNLPYTRLVSRQVVSLPMYPELTDVQISKVCDAVNEVTVG